MGGPWEPCKVADMQRVEHLNVGLAVDLEIVLQIAGVVLVFRLTEMDLLPTAFLIAVQNLLHSSTLQTDLP